MNTLHSLISLFILLSCFLSFSTLLPKQHCLDNQRSPLLQLQHHLYYAPNFTLSSKFELWDLNTDCCSWEGVSCDSLGRVIGLDLSYRNLSGSFHSIFHLHHLRRLNLAGNYFNTTLFSYGFEKLPNLTHLNLSNSCFHGQIPVEISYLTRLVSLDLSRQDDCYTRNHDSPALKLEKPNLKTLIKNLKFLKELYLDDVDISTQSSKWCETTSLMLPNLQVLSLSNCGLEGPLCPSLSALPFLSKLVLDYNPISSLPSTFLEISSPLVSLSLKGCDLTGHLTESIGNLKFLRDLTLSQCSLIGSIPSSIVNLSDLVNLDLSFNDFRGHFPTKILLLPKIQRIELSENIKLMGHLPEFPTNNALRSLSLYHTNFGGKLSGSISNLKFLTDLNLGDCNFFGSIPWSIANLSHLVSLDLSENHLSGNLPQSIGNLNFLRGLNIKGCNLFGSIPSSIANLSHLVSLDLSENNLSGSIPFSLFALPSLRVLSLTKNQLVGEIEEFPNASSSLMEELDLSYNCLSGALPKSILQLNNLRDLDLSSMSLFIDNDNRSLADFSKLESLSLRSCNLTGFPEFIKTLDKLDTLDLSNNQIQGVVPNWLWKASLSSVDLSYNPIDFPKQGDANFSSPLLWELYLESCNISVFPEVLRSLENLEFLFLSNNKISGAIPNWVWKTSLMCLDLANNQILTSSQASLPTLICNLSHLEVFIASHNKLSGPIPNCLGNMSQLGDFSVSHNNLSGPIPNGLENMINLRRFDASHNNLSGQIPNCLGNMSHLDSLNLQGNKLDGILPEFSKEIELRFLKVGENKLEGQLPRSLAECTQLQVLDVGNNMIHDTFPFWLKKLPKLAVLIIRENRFYGQITHLKHKIGFPALDVLDIASNQFDGKLSIDFLQGTQLRSLKIGANKLEGKMPSSLANCKKLEVLDLGNNMIHDTFPFWLEKLPSLKVLILRGNRFYGTITRVETKHGFPKLRILDIASNNFSGVLSIEFLQSLKAMMQNDDKAMRKYIGEEYYQDSVTIVNKGIEMFYEKVLTILTCLDVSNNIFHGRIPEEIQFLMSLIVLNLSHNSFSGEIPSTLDNLKDLESLDLSQNNLSGKIPTQFASLTFLEALNLSYNQLEGSIPQSNQFHTFSNDSYIGNPKLCGPPLSRKCNEVGLPMPPPLGDDEEDSWLDAMSTWQIVLVGYASGLVVGVCIGYTVMNELRNKWVDKFKSYGKRKRRRSR